MNRITCIFALKDSSFKEIWIKLIGTNKNHNKYLRIKMMIKRKIKTIKRRIIMNKTNKTNKKINRTMILATIIMNKNKIVKIRINIQIKINFNKINLTSDRL